MGKHGEGNTIPVQSFVEKSSSFDEGGESPGGIYEIIMCCQH